MKRIYMTLANLPLKKTGKIINLNCETTTKRRLLDLGLIEGSSITPLLISPSSDPRAFEIRGTIIAIRKEDASKIYVEF